MYSADQVITQRMSQKRDVWNIQLVIFTEETEAVEETVTHSALADAELYHHQFYRSESNSRSLQKIYIFMVPFKLMWHFCVNLILDEYYSDIDDIGNDFYLWYWLPVCLQATLIKTLTGELVGA